MGGGMVTTQDPELAERIRAVARKEPAKNLGWLRKRLVKTTFEATVTNPLVFNLGVYPALRFLQSREDSAERFASGYQPDEITMQGRMGRYTNYQAGLGLDQMQVILPQVERRVANAERLIHRLKDSVQFQSHDVDDVRSNYMLVTALFPQMHAMARRLLELGVDTKHHYMRDCSALLDDDGSFPRAAQAEREILHLPAYPELSDSKIDWIAERVQQAVDEIGSGK
jgi:dTDP-4-amino-4,6-dideoxygalactose transaminase